MYRGSCLCGVVQYAVNGELGPIAFCHCSRCRKAQGSAFASNSPIPAADFVLHHGADALTEFESTPGKFRVFCRHCGSPLYSRNVNIPGVLRLRIGTLDTPVTARPAHHIYASSHAEWFEILDTAPQYDGLEPGRKP
jgi:hypothetical protein